MGDSMSKIKKIAIICSGGDSQGMNTCLKTIVNVATVHNIEVVGFLRGYQGVIDNNFVKLTNDMVENISNLGGCYIKVGRSKEFMTTTGQQKAFDNIAKDKIDGVILLGGNGSYHGALAFVNAGIPIIGIPGTIDNDLYYTDRTLGFDTAVNNAVNAIDNIKQTMLANNRAAVVRVMGRDCGAIALNVAVACNAHALSVKEIPKTIDEIIADLKICIENGVESPLVILNDYIEYTNEDVQKAIASKLNMDSRSSVLGYIQRGGAPSVEDRLLATQFGLSAVELLLNGETDLAVGVQNRNVIHVSLMQSLQIKEEFDYNLYNQLRDLNGLEKDNKI